MNGAIVSCAGQKPVVGRIARRRLGGIGDEAGPALDMQITALETLGFSHIELRSIDGTNIGDLSQEDWSRIADRLVASELSVSVLASRIGSWARPIDTPFESDLDELVRLLRAARRLGCHRIRVMSYPNDGRNADQWREEVRRRIVILATMAADAGVTLLHENCHGWAASDPRRALALLDATGGRGLSLLYDFGNPLVHGIDPLAYLEGVLPHVAHCHVKDAQPATGNAKCVFTMPGEGEVPIIEAIDRLLVAGYEGGFSIEPHIDLLPHSEIDTGTGDAESFVAWGAGFRAMLDREFGLQ